MSASPVQLSNSQTLAQNSPRSFPPDNRAIFRIGDLIYLKCDETDGYLGSDGLVADGCKIGDHSCCFDECVFQLHLQNQYSAFKELEDYIEGLVMDDGSIRKERDANRLLRALYKGKGNEQTLNDSYMKQNIGKPVKFGDIIQLLHVKSGKFITTSHTAVAVLERENLKVFLSKDGNQMSWVNLLPKLPIEKFGNPVINNSEVFLRISERPNEYLHSSNRRQHDINMREMNCSLEKTSWKIHLYQSAASRSTEELQSGDIVSLLDPEAKSYLRPLPANIGAVGYRKGHDIQIITEEGNDYLELGCNLVVLDDPAAGTLYHRHKKFPKAAQKKLQAISREAIKGAGDIDSNMLWVVEKQDSRDGGKLNWKQDLIRVRHVNSGAYLILDSSHVSLIGSPDVSDNGQPYLCFSRKENNLKNSSTLFNVVPIHPFNPLLPDGCAIQIHQQTISGATKDSKGAATRDLTVTKLHSFGSIMLCNMEEVHRRSLTGSYSNSSNVEAESKAGNFIVNRVPSDQHSDIFFGIAAFKQLVNVSSKFYQPAESAREAEDNFNNLVTLVDKMSKFLRGKEDTSLASVMTTVEIQKQATNRSSNRSSVFVSAAAAYVADKIRSKSTRRASIKPANLAQTKKIRSGSVSPPTASPKPVIKKKQVRKNSEAFTDEALAAMNFTSGNDDASVDGTVTSVLNMKHQNSESLRSHYVSDASDGVDSIKADPPPSMSSKMLDLIKRRQVLMQEQGILDFLLDRLRSLVMDTAILASYNDGGEYGSEMLCKVESNEAYWELWLPGIIHKYLQVIYYALRWNHSSQLYAAEIIPTLIDLTRTNEVARRCVFEMLYSNRDIQDIKIGLEEIQRFFVMMSNHPMAALPLLMLRAICSCRGKGVNDNQCMIADSVVNQDLSECRLMLKISGDVSKLKPCSWHKINVYLSDTEAMNDMVRGISLRNHGLPQLEVTWILPEGEEMSPLRLFGHAIIPFEYIFTDRVPDSVIKRLIASRTDISSVQDGKHKDDRITRFRQGLDTSETKKLRKKVSRYFVAEIDLAAELCLDRNYISISKLENFFPFDTLLTIIKTKDVTVDMKAACVRLITCLYVDREPQTLWRVPMLTRIWSDINGASIHDGSAVKSSCFALLQDLIGEHIDNDLKKEKWSLMTLRVVELLEKLVKFQFYTVPVLMSDIVMPLLGSLDKRKSDKKKTNKAEAKKALVSANSMSVKSKDTVNENSKKLFQRQSVFAIPTPMVAADEPPPPRKNSKTFVPESLDGLENSTTDSQAIVVVGGGGSKYFSKKKDNEVDHEDADELDVHEKSGTSADTWQAKTFRKLESIPVVSILLILVLAAVFVAIATSLDPGMLDESFDVVSFEICIAIIFAVEIVLRMYCYFHSVGELLSFVSNPYYLIDIFVVLIDVAIFIVEYLASSSTSNSSGFFKALRSIRLVRLSRLLRAVRLMKKIADEIGEAAPLAPKWEPPARYSKTSEHEVRTMESVLKILLFMQNISTDTGVTGILQAFNKWLCGKDNRNKREIMKSAFQDSANTLSLENTNVDEIILDLLMYDDKNLVQQALTCLMVHHSRHMNILKTATRVQLLVDVEQQELFHRIKNLLKLLESHAETHEIWAVMSCDNHVTIHEEFFALMDDLLNLLRKRKSTLSLGSHYEPDKQIQNCCRNLGFFDIALKVYELRTEIERTSLNAERKAMTRRIIKKSNELLSWFILGNELNQRDAFDYLQDFVSSIEDDLNTAIVVRAIFEGNERMMKMLPKQIVATMIESIVKNGRDPSYLELLSVLTNIGEKNFLEFQYEIVKQMTSPSCIQRVLWLPAEEDSEDYLRRKEMMRPFLDQDHLVLGDLPAELAYHCKLLYLLSGCTVGKINVTTAEAKLQSVYPYCHVLTALIDDGTMLLCRFHLAYFFYNCVIDVETPVFGLSRDPLLWNYLSKLPAAITCSAQDLELLIGEGSSSQEQSAAWTRLNYLIIIVKTIKTFFEIYYTELDTSSAAVYSPEALAKPKRLQSFDTFESRDQRRPSSTAQVDDQGDKSEESSLSEENPLPDLSQRFDSSELLFNLFDSLSYFVSIIVSTEVQDREARKARIIKLIPAEDLSRFHACLQALSKVSRSDSLGQEATNRKNEIECFLQSSYTTELGKLDNSDVASQSTSSVTSSHSLPTRSSNLFFQKVIPEDSDVSHHNGSECGELITSNFHKFLENNDDKAFEQDEYKQVISSIESIQFMSEFRNPGTKYDLLLRRLIDHIRRCIETVENGFSVATHVLGRSDLSLMTVKKHMDSSESETATWIINLFRKMIESKWKMDYQQRDIFGNDTHDAASLSAQRNLNKNGATTLCLDLIASGIDEKLVLEAVKLLICLLLREGGNLPVQTIIHNHLTNRSNVQDSSMTDGTVEKLTKSHGQNWSYETEENIKVELGNKEEEVFSKSTESFFCSVHEQIEWLMKWHEELAVFSSQENTIMNQSYSDSIKLVRNIFPESKKTIKFNSDVTTIKDERFILKEISIPLPENVSILRLVQLMCEGHYLKNQDIIRQQFNIVNVNLLNDLSSFLGQLSKLIVKEREFQVRRVSSLASKQKRRDIEKLLHEIVLSNAVSSCHVEASQKVCDVILELLQGPCEGNQQHFAMNTDLLETLNRFMRIKSSIYFSVPLQVRKCPSRSDLSSLNERQYRERLAETYAVQESVRELRHSSMLQSEIDLKKTVIDIFQALLEGNSTDGSSQVFERVMSVIHLDIVQMLCSSEKDAEIEHDRRDKKRSRIVQVLLDSTEHFSSGLSEENLLTAAEVIAGMSYKKRKKREVDRLMMELDTAGSEISRKSRRNVFFLDQEPSDKLVVPEPKSKCSSRGIADIYDAFVAWAVRFFRPDVEILAHRLVSQSHQLFGMLRFQNKDELSKLQTEVLVLIEMLCNQKESVKKEVTLPKDLKEIVAKNVGSVEIVWRGELQRRFFRIPAICHYLPPSSRDKLVEEINRSNQETKIMDFIKRSRDLYREVRNQRQLDLIGISKIFSGTNQNRSTWLSFYIAIIINLLLISFYHTNSSGDDVELDPYVQNLITVLNALQIGFSVFTLTMFLVVKAPGKYYLLRSMGKTKLYSLSKTASDGFIVYYFIYVIVAVLGASVSYGFLPLLLLDIVVKSSTTKDVLLAVVYPFRQLAMTLILMLFIIYIFSMFVFLSFRDQLSDGQARDCDSLWNCLKFSLSYGLRTDGGIGDYLTHSLNERLLFDLIFYVIVLVILLNIIFGIIIDTFGELRSIKSEKMKDTKERCFICGIDKAIFDRVSDTLTGFREHIKMDHNMWHYFFYMCFIWEQDRDEDDGLEQFVRQCIDGNDLSWFPMGKSSTLNPKKVEYADKSSMQTLPSSLSLPHLPQPDSVGGNDDQKHQNAASQPSQENASSLIRKNSVVSTPSAMSSTFQGMDGVADSKIDEASDSTQLLKLLNSQLKLVKRIQKAKYSNKDEVRGHISGMIKTLSAINQRIEEQCADDDLNEAELSSQETLKQQAW